MTEPTSNYPVPPPPPVSSWTAQDPYAPYASRHGRASDQQDPDQSGPGPMPPFEPYAGGPPSAPPYEPYAGGPGYSGPGYGSPYGVPPGAAKPPAHWPLSIAGVLFSFVFGAFAIYFSAQVGRRWNRGDADGARRASRTARRLGIIAIVVGAIGTAILLSAGSR